MWIDLLSSLIISTDMLYYTTRFIDDLQDDIKSVIIVQRPANLDTVYTLAMLQEEVADAARKKEFHGGTHLYARANPKGALPLPLPPPNKLHSTAGASQPPNAIRTTYEKWHDL